MNHRKHRLLAWALALMLAFSGFALAEDAEPVSEPIDEAVLEQAEAQLEPPAEDWVAEGPDVSADGDGAEVAAFERQEDGTYKVVPDSIAFDDWATTVFYTNRAPTRLTCRLNPSNAETTLTWKSSKPSVISVDDEGYVTPLKPGKAKITVKTDNGKKASLKVTVRRNFVDKINPKPTRADIDAIGSGWDLQLKSVEVIGLDRLVAEFYLINGAGKSKYIKDLGIQLKWFGSVVAKKRISKLKVACDKGKCKRIRITFSGKDVTFTDGLQLPGFRIRAEVFTDPKLVCANGIAAPFYMDSESVDRSLPQGVKNELVIAKAVLKQVNRERVALGLKPLEMDAELTRGACVRAGEIAKSFSHTRPDGRYGTTVSAKAEAENISMSGYEGMAIEKIGPDEAKKIVQNLMSSDSHRVKIVNSRYTKIGICVYRTKVQENGYVYLYWVQEYGR